MGQYRIVMNMAVRNKGCLKWRDNIVEERLQPICKQFGDDLVNNIAEADGARVMHRGGTQLLWN